MDFVNKTSMSQPEDCDRWKMRKADPNVDDGQEHFKSFTGSQKY